MYLKRPKRWSSYAGEIGEAPANLVERDFHADAPNMLWVTDVTQFTMDGYKCWLSPVVCFASMFVRQVRQCFSAVWADGFPRCRHRFPVM